MVMDMVATLSVATLAVAKLAVASSMLFAPLFSKVDSVATLFTRSYEKWIGSQDFFQLFNLFCTKLFWELYAKADDKCTNMIFSRQP